MAYTSAFSRWSPHAWALIAVLVMSACQSTDGSSAGDPLGRWTLSAIDATRISDVEAWIQIEPDKLSGNAGCNTINGKAQISAATVSIGPIAGTKKMCPGGNRMEVERSVIERLHAADKVTFSDGAMTLSGGAGSLTWQRINR